MKTYCIKEGYTSREAVPHFDDTPFRDEFQDDVYEYASKIHTPLCRVMDVGCGSGFKLLKWFRHLPTLGFEVQPTLAWLKEHYSNRDWLAFGSKPIVLGGLLICSDVIEHVEDPNILLEFICTLNPDRIVISTPDRDVLQLDTQDGPPRNIHHVREWNHDEFVKYLEQWFVINDSVRGKTTIVQCSMKRG